MEAELTSSVSGLLCLPAERTALPGVCLSQPLTDDLRLRHQVLMSSSRADDTPCQVVIRARVFCQQQAALPVKVFQNRLSALTQ